MFSVVVEVCVQYVVWESDQGNMEAKGNWKEGGGSKKTEMRIGDIVKGKEKALNTKRAQGEDMKFRNSWSEIKYHNPRLTII